MTIDTPEKLDELTPHQLVAEIQQISAQYATEVPGSRRNWPESIRARILALGRLGIAKKRIAELTGIPAATVFLWCRSLPRTGRRKSGRFIELKNDLVPTVGLTVVTPTVGAKTTGTIAPGLMLRTPNGFVFENLASLEDLARLYRELSR
jgi:transposase-like protein